MPPDGSRADRGPPAAVSVALELARAAADVVAFPARLAVYLARRRALRAELLRDLAGPPAPVHDAARAPGPDPAARGARGPRVFVSCAEASGELHALTTLRALRARCRAAGLGEPELSGLGGAALRGAGVATVGDPVARAAMGFSAVLRSLAFYLRLLLAAARHLRAGRVDVCLLVDSPALHVPLGRIARRAGVPVVHFVAPQHWGWAPWRAAGYRSAVDRSLTILPFEPAWFARRGVPTVHVGHPLLDALAGTPGGVTPESSRTLALLAGSRRGVIERNLPWMLARAVELRREHPDLEVVLPHARAELEPLLRAHVAAAGAGDWARLSGDLHGTLRGTRAALSVSGTVLLDLLHHRLPAVVVYRVRGASGTWMYENLLTAPWFASPNLLAGREVVPEFCFAGDGPLERVRQALRSAWADPAWRTECRRGLEEAARRLGPPGACGRAADAVLELARRPGGEDALP